VDADADVPDIAKAKKNTIEVSVCSLPGLVSLCHELKDKSLPHKTLGSVHRKEFS